MLGNMWKAWQTKRFLSDKSSRYHRKSKKISFCVPVQTNSRLIQRSSGRPLPAVTLFVKLRLKFFSPPLLFKTRFYPVNTGYCSCPAIPSANNLFIISRYSHQLLKVDETKITIEKLYGDFFILYKN